MSRNLGRTDCAACPFPHVVLLEQARPVTQKEAGAHFSGQYVGMMVANAECPQCLAKYLAWVSGSFSFHWRNPKEAPGYSDLSYRASFNDEPATEDLPVYEVQRIVTYKRARIIARCENGFDLERGDHVNCYQCQRDALLEKAKERGEWSPTMTRAGQVVWTFPEYYSTREEAEVASKQHHAHMVSPDYIRRWGVGASMAVYGVKQWSLKDDSK